MLLPRILIPYLQIGHGLFNLSLFAAFVYQGRLGWLVRRNRKAGNPPNVQTVRGHRAMGPILAGLLLVGYMAGLVLSYLDHGVWAKFPLHLDTGSLLLVAVTATTFVSQKIREMKSRWRTPHFVIGIAILIIFLCQVFLGINVLL